MLASMAISFPSSAEGTCRSSAQDIALLVEGHGGVHTLMCLTVGSPRRRGVSARTTLCSSTKLEVEYLHD